MSSRTDDVLPPQPAVHADPTDGFLDTDTLRKERSLSYDKEGDAGGKSESSSVSGSRLPLAPRSEDAYTPGAAILHFLGLRKRRADFDLDAVRLRPPAQRLSPSSLALLTLSRSLSCPSSPRLRRPPSTSFAYDPVGLANLSTNPPQVATQESVFDGPLAAHYQPSDKWENIGAFDPDERWSHREERAVRRKIVRPLSSGVGRRREPDSAHLPLFSPRRRTCASCSGCSSCSSHWTSSAAT